MSKPIKLTFLEKIYYLFDYVFRSVRSDIKGLIAYVKMLKNNEFHIGDALVMSFTINFYKKNKRK